MYPGITGALSEIWSLGKGKGAHTSEAVSKTYQLHTSSMTASPTHKRNLGRSLPSWIWALQHSLTTGFSRLYYPRTFQAGVLTTSNWQQRLAKTSAVHYRGRSTLSRPTFQSRQAITSFPFLFQESNMHSTDLYKFSTVSKFRQPRTGVVDPLKIRVQYWGRRNEYSLWLPTAIGVSKLLTYSSFYWRVLARFSQEKNEGRGRSICRN